ncbi:MAG: hypothetical protein AAF944_29440 [Bacteroidota bacterium]
MRELFRLILYCLIGAIITTKVIGSVPEPKAAFSVDILNPDIYTYECYVVTASLLIHSQNEVPLQFYNLGEQVPRIASKLTPEQAWKHNNNIADIQQVNVIRNGQSYYQYKIVELGICPISAGTVTIPPIELVLARVNSDGEITDSVTLISEAQYVTVRELPEGIADSVYQNDAYLMIGKYRLEENNPTLGNNHLVGDTIDYQLSILGRGSGFPIELNTVSSQDMEIIVKETFLQDTIQYRALRTKKVFHLQIIPWKKDTLRLSDYISWQYYNPSEKKIKSIRSEKEFYIRGKEIQKPFAIKRPPPEVVFIMDVSNSMMIQDYGGSGRLTAGVDLINQMATKRPHAPIVLFSGAAYLWGTKPLDYDLMNQSRPRGTAIGNALWLAKEILKKSSFQNKRVILVCDGDDTNGKISEVLAAQICSQYDIKVDCVGLGHQGIFPFGYDSAGQIRYVENSFQDASLKKVASITGGQYVWMDNAEEIESVVNKLFP